MQKKEKKHQECKKQWQKNEKNEVEKEFVSACCKFQSIFVVLTDEMRATHLPEN